MIVLIRIKLLTDNRNNSIILSVTYYKYASTFFAGRAQVYLLYECKTRLK